MLKSDDLKNQLDNLKNDISNLKNEGKIEEAHSKLGELDNLKNQINLALEEEKAELEKINKSLNMINERGDVFNMRKSVELFNKITVEEKAQVENLVRGIQNGLTSGQNGFLIPTTVASTIIARAEEVSKVYSRCKQFNVSGDLIFPKTSTGVVVNYVEEGSAFQDSTPTLGNVKVGSFIAGALCKISKSLINKAGLDITAYVIEELGKGLAKFLDRECVVGTEGKATGLVSTANIVTVTALNADALIDAQLEVDETVENCVWIMNKNTLKKVRKFKGTDGQYLLCASIEEGFKYQILGDGVIVSKDMVDDQIVYADLQAEYVKLANNVEIQILTEKYADTHQIGVIGNVEMDAKLVEDDKVVLIKVQA